MAGSDEKTEALLKQILEKVNSDDFESKLLMISRDISTVKNNFDSFRTSISKVETEIEKIKYSGDIREKTLNDVHKSIFDPEAGIYMKLNENKSKFQKMDSKISDIEDEIEKQLKEAKEELIAKIEESESDINKKISDVEKDIKGSVSKASERLDTTEGKIKLVEQASGDPTFSDLRNAIDAHKNFNKIWWALIISVVSGFGKVIWDLVKEIR